MYTPNQSCVDDLLQTKTLHITASRKSAVDSINAEELVVPDVLPQNMLVVLRPHASALLNEKFWLGTCFYFALYINNKILGRIDSEPNDIGVYKVRFYRYQHKTNWAPGRGKIWYGTCTQESVLLAGVTLTNTNNLTAQTLRHIDYILQKDK
jgi:hypothetical protein